MKKFFLTTSLGMISLGFFIPHLAHSYCPVTSEADSGNYTLRDSVETWYNESDDYPGSNCWSGNEQDDDILGSLDLELYDDGLGFNQAILFQTNELGWGSSVETIILTNPITFNSNHDNVVVGNWPKEFPDAPSSSDEYSYPVSYDPVDFDTGMVVIEAYNDFGSSEPPFKCAEDTKPVILRNLIVHSRLTKTELLAQQSCLQDGGSFYVCNKAQLPTSDPRNHGTKIEWCSDIANDLDDDGFTIQEGDCDDFDASIHPNATDQAGDGVDQDCDGSDALCTLEVTPVTSTIDAGDSKTFNVSLNGVGGYEETAHIYVSGLDPSMDSDNGVWPYGGISISDGGTQPFNVLTDITTPPGTYHFTFSASSQYGTSTSSQLALIQFYSCKDTVTLTVNPVDNDGDGVPLPEDCDDTDPSIYPGAPEVCSDGVDNDCDGAVDEDCGGDDDDDGDGYCEDPSTCDDGTTPGDCDDGDDDVYPGAPEVCDGEDNDCDGLVDEEGICGETDDDGDGYCEGELCSDGTTPGDCDDADITIHPWAEDMCGDLIDQDCSGGDIPCYDPVITYPDLDEDGYGDTNNPTIDDDGVILPGETVVGGDCDDTNWSINPGADELCADDLDNDCDGRIDEVGCIGDDSGVDNDGDGQCEGQICTDGSTPGDCDDTDPNFYWGAPELCDGLDNDCDAFIDNGLLCDIGDEPPTDFDMPLRGASVPGCSLTISQEPVNTHSLTLFFTFSLLFMGALAWLRQNKLEKTEFNG